MIKRLTAAACTLGMAVLAWGADAPESGGAGAEQQAAAAQAGAEPGSFERMEDGSLVIEGVMKVPGKGTEESPYVIDWNVLISAQRMYKPREGQTELPAWTKELEGKRVRLTGNLLLPLTGTGTSELLIMQNPWDGCCIGVPPTPFDAVEVRLTEELDTSRGAPAYGALEGVFKTDPYIVSDWLLGLYMLEDARPIQGTGDGT